MDKSKLMHFDIKILGLVWKSARDIIQEKAGPIKELSVNAWSFFIKTLLRLLAEIACTFYIVIF